MQKIELLDKALIQDAVYNGIVAIDRDGLIRYFNKTAERIFNISASDALHNYILDILPNTGGKLLECIRDKKSFVGEILKGQEVSFMANINPIYSDDSILGAVSVFQEISEVEKITKELDFFKNMKSSLDAIIDSSFDGLWICDKEGTVIRINRASEKINHIKAEDVIGKNMKDLITAELFDKSVTIEVLKNRTPITMIQQVKGGRKILITGNPIFNEKGEITFVLTNERDVTELDNLRRQLQEAHALAGGYHSRLSEFAINKIDLTDFIFRSEGMSRVIEAGLRVAMVDSTVLLLGKSGVGKGAVAKFIHKHSQRKDGPFFRVDCSAIPPSLMESELFGYEKGAFTGAKSEGKQGIFELANNGTLFLDEIGEVPIEFQSKLLRFLEDHELLRVGGTQAKRIDVRIIAATNKNIEKMVFSKMFRKDLYYRINVVPIHIPPLRERREDIIPLIFYYTERFNKAYKKKKNFSPASIDALSEYDYPGNVREVANIIERVIVMSDNERIEITDLPKFISRDVSTSMTNMFLTANTPFKDAVEKFEMLLIKQTIDKYGSQRRAARVLKVDQGTISRKVKKYRIAFKA